MFDHNYFFSKKEKIATNRLRVAYVLTLDDLAIQEVSAATIIDIQLPIKEEVLKAMIADSISVTKKAHVMNITILSVVSLDGIIEEE